MLRFWVAYRQNQKCIQITRGSNLLKFLCCFNARQKWTFTCAADAGPFSYNCNTSCVFIDLLKLISIRESKRCAHTMPRSVFRDPNVRKWLFFSFDTPSEAKFEGVFCEYCDPLLNYWTVWLWKVPEKNLKVKWRNGLHFRPRPRLDLSAGKKNHGNIPYRFWDLGAILQLQETLTTLLRIAILGLFQNPRFTQFFLKNSKINCFITLNVHGKLLGGEWNVLECMKNIFPSYFLILPSTLIRNLLFKHIF